METGVGEWVSTVPTNDAHTRTRCGHMRVVSTAAPKQLINTVHPPSRMLKFPKALVRFVPQPRASINPVWQKHSS
eukprot:5550613-Pleurochrysis_carterae.AAC.1